MTLFAVFQANFIAKYGQSSPQRGTFYGQIDIKNNFSRRFSSKNLPVPKMVLPLQSQFGALAHLVERNTGSVEVSGSSPLCSTIDFISV